LLPITTDYVKQIIESERPDAVMLAFGGQTALNCGVSLEKEGILKKYGIRVLGTPISGIEITEDRQLFKEAMIKSGVPVLESAPCYSVQEALTTANRIAYPVMIRVAYTLGGRGGGVAYNEYELQEIVQRGLALSMVGQVLIEKYVGHWKQIEYEVMRDYAKNSVIVCNMENMLSMRVHTGDNIVVAPSQTLNNYEYHMLRSAALRATDYCGIVGECNIQFGLDIRSDEYCAVEINARLSRSSALASKATGYPLAYMAAKIALGYSLPELINRITKATTACFEPSLDYVVLKMPRWDFQKFEFVKRKLGSTMKSIGEVMAIGRCFEEVLQKAIRMTDVGKDGLVANLDDMNEKRSKGSSWLSDPNTNTNAIVQGSNNDILDQAAIKNNMDELYHPNLPEIDHEAEGTRKIEQELNGLNPRADTDEIDEQISNGTNIEALEELLLHPNDEILFTVTKAMKAGINISRISDLSTVDPWFLASFANIIGMESKLANSKLEQSLLRAAKKIGFSDKQIGRCVGLNEENVRLLRQTFGIVPVVKQIDTLAAEWPAKTNYLYLTYGGDTDDILFNHEAAARESQINQGFTTNSNHHMNSEIFRLQMQHSSQKKDNLNSGPQTTEYNNQRNYNRQKIDSVIVLGAGPYRIGSSVEFDWGTVNMVWGLKESGVKKVSIINCNPETVSTDYDICDRLYFEELTFERVMDIYEKENPSGIVTCVGGQTANNLTPLLSRYGIRIIGTSSENVDKAENRSKFGRLLDQLKIKQPAWKIFTNLVEAKRFAIEVGYPILVRPSYVLSGAAMKVVWAEYQLEQFLAAAAKVSPDHPIVISKFLQDASEVEVDAVGADGKDVVIGSIVEHIDNAGVHSGDAMMCIPPWRLDRETIETIIDYTVRIGKALKVTGPFNIQYLVKESEVSVIEANVRASRTMPFVSKFIGINLIKLAAKAMTGHSITLGVKDLWLKTTEFGIKVPQFSFMQLEGADIVLGVEMQSTGEVACFGRSFYDALSKAYTAAGYSLPTKGTALITVGGQRNKERILPLASKIAMMGYDILATEHTAEYILRNNDSVKLKLVYKISEPDRKPNISDLLFSRKIDFIINIPSTSTAEKYVGMLDDEYQIRRKAVEMGVPVLTTHEAANSFINTLEWVRKNTPTLDYLRDYHHFD
jgi:carbamoyl-phosphate synthase large subunit